MSDLLKTPTIFDSKECLEKKSPKINMQKIKTRAAEVGDHITIHRALPHRDIKTIGAWCFLDHFGPLDLKHSDGLHIGPHPHMGLQTFTYLLEGEIMHRDSLGSMQKIQSGQVNLMTAGKGISHSEESCSANTLHGVQLWIALPDAVRHMEPNFIHYDNIPSLTMNNVAINLLAGDYAGLVSPVTVYTPLVGLDVMATEDGETRLPLNPSFEYGILPLIGDIEIENEVIDLSTLLYVHSGHTEMTVRMKKNSRALIIGGEPFSEDILIWWNFVARTKEEMLKAAAAWDDHSAFGEVKGYQGGRLTPPQCL